MRPFIDFVKERTYLKNVSPRTIEFYWDCNKSVLRFGDFTEAGLKRWIIGSREAGISPSSINTRITGINAYATHLLESGADLRTIQILMGHERLEDTTVYLQLSRRHLHAAVNPLEQIALPAVEEAKKR